MAVAGSVKRFLDDQGLDYKIVAHYDAFTSLDEARAVGAAAVNVAKTLVIKSGGRDLLAVLPASERLDLHKLRDLLGDNHARFASEEEVWHDFPQFALGAVPPLGELLNLPVYLDQRLEQANEIIFPGGTHRDSVKMSGEDFLKLVRPQVGDLAREPGAEMLY